MRLIRLALTLCLCMFTSTAWGQSPDRSASREPDLAVWASVAQSTENLISGGVASTSLLEARRSQLAEWRAWFLEAGTVHASRIETIEAQLSALPPLDEGGAPEPDAIAQFRAELQAELAVARVPQVQTDVAFNRANGLISEIDTLLGERQANALLRLDPSPLNPLHWITAVQAIAGEGARLWSETRLRFQDADLRRLAADQAPLLLGMVAIGIALVVRGRGWVASLSERLLSGANGRGQVSLRFLISFGQFLLPVLGLLLILVALREVGFVAEDARAVVRAAVFAALTIFFVLWIAGRMFPKDDTSSAVFGIAPALRPKARRLFVEIGLYLGLAAIAASVADLQAIPASVRGVIVVPILLLMGTAFFRLAQLIRFVITDLSDEEQAGFERLALRVLRVSLLVIALLGPALGLIGYVNAASGLMLPAATSLLLLAFLIVLRDAIRDVYALVVRKTPEQASEALLPVLVNFALFVASLPLLAVIWGLRPQQLSEIYLRILEGFSLGGAQVTPGAIAAIVLIFSGGVVATRLLQGALKTSVLPRTALDVGARNAINAGVGYVGIALAAVFAISSAGIDLTALGFVLGALSVGIGFGLQNVVSNFVSGIILLIERPISENDWIEVNGVSGIVKRISVRSTRIETFDRTDVIVPNADFVSGSVTNWTRGNTVGRVILNVGVAYGNDTRRIHEMLLEIARGHPDVSTFPAPAVDFLGFGADSLDFRVRVILRDINLFLTVQTELYHQIAERFTAEGIEIPFAQRDIWIRNPEALKPEQPAREVRENESDHTAIP